MSPTQKKPDILIWHPVGVHLADGEIGAAILVWGRDRTVLETYSHRTRASAEALAVEHGWVFEVGKAVRQAEAS